MKIIKRVLLGLALAFVCVITLASCSNATQSYADKINSAAEKSEYVTYEDAKDALGDELIDLTVTTFGSTGGIIAAVKGFNKDNYEQKLDEASDETKFDLIVIVVVNGKCTNASFSSITKGEVKAALKVQ